MSINEWWTKTWRDLIHLEMAERGDAWGATTICTLDDEALDAKIKDEAISDLSEHCWTLWTDDFVYFPTSFDNMLAVACVPRNPGAPHGHACANIDGETFMPEANTPMTPFPSLTASGRVRFGPNTIFVSLPKKTDDD